jgi:hypothetical protein
VPPLTDQAILNRLKKALSNWRFTGYVVFKPIAWCWIRSELGSFTQKGIAEILHDFVEAGGVIDQCRETREDHLHFEFHYDLRVSIAGRLIYFETVLIDDDPDEPMITVVSVHDK